MIPDPCAPATFDASKLRWEERGESRHAAMLDWYSRLLSARASDVVPFARDVRGTDAAFERIGARGLHLRWTLRDCVLHADAQLGDDPAPGFAERLDGATFITTHHAIYRDGVAPAWSVRWSRT